MKIIELEWLDACGPDICEVFSEESAKKFKPLLMHEVGYLVDEDKTRLILAPQISGCGGMRRIICIPRSLVTKRRVLR